MFLVFNFFSDLFIIFISRVVLLGNRKLPPQSCWWRWVRSCVSLVIIICVSVLTYFTYYITSLLDVLVSLFIINGSASNAMFYAPADLLRIISSGLPIGNTESHFDILWPWVHSKACLRHGSAWPPRVISHLLTWRTRWMSRIVCSTDNWVELL